MTIISRRKLLATAIAASGGAAASALAKPAGAGRMNDGLTGYLTGLHDPVMTREGDIYHIFGSGGWTGKPGLSWRVSKDLKTWTDNESPFGIPDWAQEAIPDAKSIWAPDISHVNGVYRLYYSVSTGGSMRSVTGFATNPTLDRSSPDYRWTDRGMVLESFAGGDYNVIDANFVIDANGDHWLAFGSYWSGLKLTPLDKVTGKRPAGDDSIHSIAYRPAPTGGDNPVEAPFIIVRGDYHYLFASYDYCCKKEQSNYYVAVGRSKDVRGPYVDKQGRSMMDGYGEAVLIERPWASTRWRAPGHCGIYNDNGRDIVVYHSYDAENEAAPTLRIAEMRWSDDGWPIVLM